MVFYAHEPIRRLDLESRDFLKGMQEHHNGRDSHEV